MRGPSCLAMLAVFAILVPPCDLHPLPGLPALLSKKHETDEHCKAPNSAGEPPEFLLGLFPSNCAIRDRVVVVGRRRAYISTLGTARMSHVAWGYIGPYWNSPNCH
ncbi:hypothetical protein F4820DRAFT_434844 [Hypoxylon rubiginosum]|uniref:Uncharacterized protein n=1 Tax=Hypoxylon rubiginosum TaxID=110542 RepID=A0ACB9YPC0_9PEZI|nr:hypothetical protein F4820DRAFT_434844 [Hypoxylon rubiginosum]